MKPGKPGGDTDGAIDGGNVVSGGNPVSLGRPLVFGSMLIEPRLIYYQALPIDYTAGLIQSQSVRGGLVIAAKTKRSSKRAAPAKPAAAAPENPFPPIAVTVDSEMRQRVERVWRIHNKVQPVAASKTQVYKAVMNKGLEAFEQEIVKNGWDDVVPPIPTQAA